MTDDQLFCEVCQELVYSDLKSFHEILHSRGVEKFFKCTTCDKRFYQLQSLSLHSKTTHNNSDINLSFPCPKCDFSYSSVKFLEEHYKNHAADTSASEPKRHFCRYCPSSFKKSGDRFKHELIHQGIKPHACTLCPKTFRLSCMLTVHMRTHTNERPYACKECDLTFKTHSHLRNHILCAHRTERPFTCKYCPKTFKTRNALHNHTGHHEMLYKCNDCGRSFPTRNSATQHIKKIHLSKNKDLYQCVICNATYGRALFLASHMKTHSKLDGKDDLVQQLMEMSHVDGEQSASSTPRVKRKRTAKKVI
jgi:KRAB domain-containing zinc finger protein